MIKRTFDHARPAVGQARNRERGDAHSALSLHHRLRFVLCTQAELEE